MDVYLVFARAIPTPSQLEVLGIFDSRDRAEELVDRVPMPQRQCLEIHRWKLNEATSDPFWAEPSFEPGRCARTGDAPSAVVKAVRRAEMDPQHAHLDELLKPSPDER